MENRDLHEGVGRIFCVGYFLGQPAKMKLIEMLDNREVVFLECSTSKQFEEKNRYYFPRMLSLMSARKILTYPFKKKSAKVFSVDRSLYRRDLISYFSKRSELAKFPALSKERSLAARPLTILLYALYRLNLDVVRQLGAIHFH